MTDLDTEDEAVCESSWLVMLFWSSDSVVNLFVFNGFMSFITVTSNCWSLNFTGRPRWSSCSSMSTESMRDQSVTIQSVRNQSIRNKSIRDHKQSKTNSHPVQLNATRKSQNIQIAYYNAFNALMLMVGWREGYVACNKFRHVNSQQVSFGSRLMTKMKLELQTFGRYSQTITS